MTQRAQARVGLILREKWRLDALLGVGGMAAVYAATHRNGKRGAVKMLHLELSSDADARRRFLREGYVANAVDHPGAVSVLDDDVAEDGSVFLVMELLEGQTLDARAESRPGARLEPGEVLACADQLLDVLAAAHDKGIVHRDLKPENLFLTRSGQLKVLDFGLARLQELARTSGAQRLTAAGSAMGTPAFMPPEQALGNWDQVDARTDLWAVGATLYTLLTGRFVHEADTVNKLLLAAMTKPALPLGSIDPGLPPALGAVVDRALAFEQKDRWPDARSMRAAVLAIRGGAGPDLVSASNRPPPAVAVSGPQLSSSTQPLTPIPPAFHGLTPRGAHEPTPVTSSLGPTSSEPRLGRSRKGMIAGAVLVGVLGGAAVLLALRARHPETPAAQATPIEAEGTSSSTASVQTTTAGAAPAETAKTPVVIPSPETEPRAETAPPVAEPAAAVPATLPLPTASPAAPSAGRLPYRPRPTAMPKATAAPKLDPLQKW